MLHFFSDTDENKSDSFNGFAICDRCSMKSVNKNEIKINNFSHDREREREKNRRKRKRERYGELQRKKTSAFNLK